MRNESTGPRRSTRDTVRAVALATSLFAVAPSLASAAQVVVRVDGVAVSGGTVFVSLCSGGLEPQDCSLAQKVEPVGPVVAARFADVSPGVYAAAAFQDITGSGTLDRSPRGLPREPYGLSREAGRTAAPRFDRAAFVIGADATVAVHLAMPGRP